MNSPQHTHQALLLLSNSLNSLEHRGAPFAQLVKWGVLKKNEGRQAIIFMRWVWEKRVRHERYGKPFRRSLIQGEEDQNHSLS